MNSAIIVAGGSGKRFGGGVPKQFVELRGKPLIFYSLEAFEKCPDVNEIVLVLPAGNLEAFRASSASGGFSKLSCVAPGGETRAKSVLAGFERLAASDGIVAVHDGARPLISVREISAAIKVAERDGASCLVAPLSDTIKEIGDDEKISKTIDRRMLRRALTPQCFRYGILKRALTENYLGDEATDECFLAEKIGIRISAVEGSGKNIKITLPEDLIVAQSLMERI